MKRMPLKVLPQENPTEILLGDGLLFSEEAVSDIKRLSSRCAVFCDETVAPLLGEKWTAHLEKNGLDAALFTFPSGEAEKSRERKAELEDLLFSQKFGRDTCFIALGGGVTTDLIGYLASTYCRGVPLVLAPTTLLGMVDAAIGGKTAVNTRFGKNLVGAFYLPKRVLIDLKTLSSLPASEWTNGLGEIVKYALIRSPQLFELLKNWTPDDPVYLERIIHSCVLIKAHAVETDYEEKTGYRRILNFGHTIAHALERLENYRLPHGEAVAIGMLVESDLSCRLGHLSKQECEKVHALIRSFPFSLRVSDAVTKEAMLSAMAMDKKAEKSAPRFVLLEKIGSCVPFDGKYCASVPSEKLAASLDWMLEHCSGGSR